MAVQDPVAQDVNPEKLKDVFPEHESKEKQEQLDDTNEKLFLETQTYKNLEKALPTKIEIGDKKTPIQTGKKLLDRISSNKVAYESKSQRLETAFFKHGKDFFPGLKLESVKQAPAADKEIYMQKLAIIEACFGGLINLKPDHRKELANLLLPLASKSKTNIKETENEDVEEGEKMSEGELAFTKNPAFPVLTRLLDEGLISHVNFEEIKQFYIKNKNFSGINISEHSETVQAHLDSVFNNGPANQKKNIAHFFEDFPEGSEEEMEYKPVLKMIAENYIPIIGKNSSKNIQLDYFTAVEVSANIVLEKYQNIDTLSVKYEDAMKLIKNGSNFVDRYKGLKMLIELAGEHEGQFAQLEKQHKRTRIEQLLIESHNRDFQRVKNDAEGSRLARELEEQERDDENNSDDEESIESQLDALPLGKEELEVQEGEEGSSISK